MAKVEKVAGPVVVCSGMRGSKMYDLVKVGSQELLGEIIQLKDDTATVQVYEDTTSLKPGESVKTTNAPLSVQLGPGLINSILDGIGRPLVKIASKTGNYIQRGISVPTLDPEVKYKFKPMKKKGDMVHQGMCIGVVKETEVIENRMIVPQGVSGKIVDITRGDITSESTVATVKTERGLTKIGASQKWPVRKGRPKKERVAPCEPLLTGQRVFDTFFPVAKGGTAAIPGPFGAGKTVSQHQITKWSDADVIVYVGCGERGNEMTDVLTELPRLTDPKTGKSLMQRTVLIANTSNMPVAAREASIYTGITIAEYYRDMGYDVALMADSTSRWAEAMREISSRLEEMPGEEGYPAYLASRLAQFYERAGKVETLEGKKSSVTVIGAVSPQGGDFSEPVTQSTLRFVKVFWALESALAYKRHFPSINWTDSYSLYIDELEDYYKDKVAIGFLEMRKRALSILKDEERLLEIVRLVGPDALPESDKLNLLTAKSIREDFLQQDAFHDVDSYCPISKQKQMLELIIYVHDKIKEALEHGFRLSKMAKTGISQRIAKLKYTKDVSSDIISIKQLIDTKISDNLSSKPSLRDEKLDQEAEKEKDSDQNEIVNKTEIFDSKNNKLDDQVPKQAETYEKKTKEVEQEEKQSTMNYDNELKGDSLDNPFREA